MQTITETLSNVRPTTSSASTGGSSQASEKVRAVMAAILQVWPSAKIDRADPAGVWGASVNDLSTEQIRHGIVFVARSTDKFPPTPGQFRNLALTWRAPVSTRPREINDQSARTAALRACQSRFAMRLAGTTPAEPPTVRFDVQAVLDAVYWDPAERQRAKDEGFNAAMRFDQELFAQLRRAFDARWGAEAA